MSTSEIKKAQPPLGEAVCRCGTTIYKGISKKNPDKIVTVDGRPGPPTTSNSKKTARFSQYGPAPTASTPTTTTATTNARATKTWWKLATSTPEKEMAVCNPAQSAQLELRSTL